MYINLSVVKYSVKSLASIKKTIQIVFDCPKTSVYILSSCIICDGLNFYKFLTTVLMKHHITGKCL